MCVHIHGTAAITVPHGHWAVFQCSRHFCRSLPLYSSEALAFDFFPNCFYNSRTVTTIKESTEMTLLRLVRRRRAALPSENAEEKELEEEEESAPFCSLNADVLAKHLLHANFLSSIVILASALERETTIMFRDALLQSRELAFNVIGIKACCPVCSSLGCGSQGALHSTQAAPRQAMRPSTCHAQQRPSEKYSSGWLPSCP